MEYIASFMNSAVSYHFQPGFLWLFFINALIYPYSCLPSAASSVSTTPSEPLFVISLFVIAVFIP